MSSTPTGISRVIGVCAIAAALIAPGFAFAAPSQQERASVREASDSRTGRVVVLLRDMQWLRGTLVSFDQRQLVHRTSADVLSTIDAADVVALFRAEQFAPSTASFVEFVDGQRLPGRPVLADGQFRWRHALLDTIPLELETLFRIVIDPSAPVVTAPRDDVIVLTNGDRLEGIVTELGATVLLERIDASSDVVTTQRIPFDRIASIAFVNQPIDDDGGWPTTLWLADGSVLRTERPTLGDDGILRFRPELATRLRARQTSENASTGDGGNAAMDASIPNRPSLLPIDAVAGVLFLDDEITPLATLVPDAVDVPIPRLSRRGPQVLRPDAPMGLSTIRMQGPLAVHYRLDRPGLRFVAEAWMPDEALAWGDLELVIEDGAGERLRQRVHAGHRLVSIDLILETDHLTVRLEEGERGPIQDVILLREAILGPGQP